MHKEWISIAKIIKLIVFCVYMIMFWGFPKLMEYVGWDASFYWGVGYTIVGGIIFLLTIVFLEPPKVYEEDWGN